MVICDATQCVVADFKMESTKDDSGSRITVKVCAENALRACPYILVPEELTAASLLETHDNTWRHNFPSNFAKTIMAAGGKFENLKN